jgi:hypothetical protein
MSITPLRDAEKDTDDWAGVDIYTENDLDDIDDSRHIDGINTYYNRVSATDVMVDLDDFDSFNYGTQKQHQKLFDNEDLATGEEYLVNKGSVKRGIRPDISSAYRHFLNSIEIGDEDE